jgi:hypothetical protein
MRSRPSKNRSSSKQLLVTSDVNDIGSGVQAAAQYKGGILRALSHVFARIDVVLAPSEPDPAVQAQLSDYEREGEDEVAHVQPFVNEVYS